MAHCPPEHPHFEMGIMGNDDLGVGQTFQNPRRNPRKLWLALNVKPRQAMAFNKVLPEEAVTLWGTDEPMQGFLKFATLKDRDSNGADAGIGAVRRFKIQGRDDHTMNPIFFWLPFDPNRLPPL